MKQLFAIARLLVPVCLLFLAAPLWAAAPRTPATFTVLAPKPTKTPSPPPTRTRTPTASATATTPPAPSPSAVVSATPIAGAAGPPLACNPGELFTDAQDWWSNPDGGTGNDFGHLHIGVCWPHKATLTQSFPIAVRTVIHRNPGSFYRMMVQVFQARDANAPALCNDSDAIDCLTFTPARTLATCIETGGALRDNGETCVWTDQLHINLASIGYSGWQQFRFRAFVREPDTKEMRVWTGLHANVENGKPLKHVYEDPNVVEGRGWYTGANYANASIKSPPLTAVSGVWQPYVEMEKGANGLTLTDHFAALDTDFHHVDRGVVVREGSGEFRGNLAIDTTRLTNGWHRLLLKANAFDSQTGSTNSGVLVIYFEVRNE